MKAELSKRCGPIAGGLRKDLGRQGYLDFLKALESADTFQDLPMKWKRAIINVERRR